MMGRKEAYFIASIFPDILSTTRLWERSIQVVDTYMLVKLEMGFNIGGNKYWLIVYSKKLAEFFHVSPAVFSPAPNNF
jgi:hypothetical protein